MRCVFVGFISLLPRGTHPHFPNPPLPSSSLLTSSSSLLLPSHSAMPGHPLSFVWLLILAKRTDQIFLLQCTRLSVGASQIWWLGLTDGRGPRVLKSVTDSGGFDSPRSSCTRSPKTPGEKRGERRRVGGVGGLRRGGRKRKRDRAGNKSICRVVRAGGGSSSSRQRLFEVYTWPSPPFLSLFPPVPLFPSFLPSFPESLLLPLSSCALFPLAFSHSVSPYALTPGPHSSCCNWSKWQLSLSPLFPSHRGAPRPAAMQSLAVISLVQSVFLWVPKSSLTSVTLL